MRSTTEAKRASELNATGNAWFYEVHSYHLQDGRTYLPDFWITNVPVQSVLGVLGDNPSQESIRQFLAITPHQVEDVKGWYQSDHPSFQRVETFRAEHPWVDFHVLVMGKGGRQWV